MSRLGSFFSKAREKVGQAFSDFSRSRELKRGIEESRERQRQAAAQNRPATSFQSSVVNPYIPPTKPFEPEPVEVPEPAYYGGGGGGYGGPSAEEVLQARIQENEQRQQQILNDINLIANQFGVPENLRSFAFDEAAARLRAEQNFNPYFTSELNDYLKQVDIQRRRFREDFDTASAKAQEKEKTFFRREERQSLIDSLADRRAVRLKGIIGSGVGEREKALGELGREERRQDVRQEFDEQEQARDLSKSRFEESTGLEEELRRRDTERKRTQAVEEDIGIQREREEGRFAEERAQNVASSDAKRAEKIRAKEQELDSLRSLI